MTDEPIKAFIADNVSLVQLAELLAPAGIVIRQNIECAGIYICVDEAMRERLRSQQRFAIRRLEIQKELREEVKP